MLDRNFDNSVDSEARLLSNPPVTGPVKDLRSLADRGMSVIGFSESAMNSIAFKAITTRAMAQFLPRRWKPRTKGCCIPRWVPVIRIDATNGLPGVVVTLAQRKQAAHSQCSQEAAAYAMHAVNQNLWRKFA